MKPLFMLDAARTIGEEFVVWLWMQGLTTGGLSGLDGDLTACFLDDRMALVSERGDVREVSLSRGNPAESREAFEALARGMRPASAKLRLLSGDFEWVFVLHAATLELHALKMPSASSKDPLARMADRLFLLEEGVAHVERRFKAFLAERTTNPETLEASVQAWIRDGLAPYTTQEPAAVPWKS